MTIEDDHADPLAVGLPFDADGTPKRKVTMVDAGVSTSLAHDLRTAKRAGDQPPAMRSRVATPSGRTLQPALPARRRSLPDMIAAVERGLFITTFNYCRILDPRTQVVTGLTRNGTFLIEAGRSPERFPTSASPNRSLRHCRRAGFSGSATTPGWPIVRSVRA